MLAALRRKGSKVAARRHNSFAALASAIASKEKRQANKTPVLRPTEADERASGAGGDAPPLIKSHPGIAGGWITASSRLATPHNIASTSRRDVWWRCAGCHATFRKSVAEHVAARGQCPSCKFKPSKAQRYPSLSPQLKFRKLSNRQSLFADQGNRVRQSVADADSEAKSKNGQATAQGSPLRRGRLPSLQQRNLQPMLAHPWEKYCDTIREGETLFVSPKLDGVRCLAAWDPARQRVVLISRFGTVIQSCKHLKQMLRPLFKVDPYLVLDGELYHHTAFDSFEELSGLVRRSDSTDERVALIQFHLFDVLSTRLRLRVDAGCLRLAKSNSDCRGPYRMRLALLHKILEAGYSAEPHKSRRGKRSDQSEDHSLNGVPSHIRLVPAIPTSLESISTALQRYLQKGYEGIIIRRDGHPYGAGKRSPYLLKYKQVNDSEFPICGVVEGSGKWKRSLAAFTCSTSRGEIFRASPAVTAERRRKLWQQRDALIGKMLTVQYQQLSGRGIPRFPVGKAIRGSQNQRDWL